MNETAIATVPTTETVAWGEAHPQRGANYNDIARAFVAEFPPTTTLFVDDFDNWAQRRGLLNVPTGAPKKSDAWMAHRQRRNDLRYDINRAGSHRRMHEGSTPFVVEMASAGVLEVRSLDVAISKTSMSKVETVCTTKRRQLAWLLQAVDWTQLLPHERAYAEALYDDISMFERRITLDADGLASKFLKLANKVRKALPDTGAPWPDGPVKGLLEEEISGGNSETGTEG